MHLNTSQIQYNILQGKKWNQIKTGGILQK